MGLTDCPETSVTNYHSVLHNISDERRSHMMIWWCRPWFGSVQNDPVWHGQVRCFTCESGTSHI